MKHKLIFANNNYYRSWSNQRDVAAERLLDNSKRKTTEITDKAFARVLEIISARYHSINHGGLPNHQALDHLHKAIVDVFNNSAHDIYAETIQLRQKAWMLSHVAEAVAVAKISQKKPAVKASHHDVSRQSQNSKLLTRIQMHFHKLSHNIMIALSRSIIAEDTLPQALGRAYKAMPKRNQITTVKKLKRLTKVREAKVNPFIDGGTNAIAFSDEGKLYDWQFDQATWDKVVQDYQDEYIPIDRSPANQFDITNPFNDEPIKDEIPTSDAIYGWEVEQETTHDFVTAVRDGEISAAKENGVDDFMWVAILDKKTCEQCCEWRDGLTSAEIQETLDGSEQLKSYCDAIVPPAHFNCRCRPAPISNSLDDYEPPADQGLDEWLMSM